MRRMILLLATLAVAVPCGGSAKEKYKEVVNAGTSEQFADVIAGIREQLKPGGRYEFVPPDERTTIDANVAAIEKLFAENGGLVDNMNHEEKVALFNAQESVNAILTHRDSDRVICQHIKPIGSNIPKTKCHTFGQAEEARRDTTRMMDKWKQVPCAAANCALGLPGGNQ